MDWSREVHLPDEALRISLFPELWVLPLLTWAGPTELLLLILFLALVVIPGFSLLLWLS